MCEGRKGRVRRGRGVVGMWRRGDEGDKGKALFYHHTSIKSCYAMHVPRRSFSFSFSLSLFTNRIVSMVS